MIRKCKMKRKLGVFRCIWRPTDKARASAYRRAFVTPTRNDNKDPVRVV